MKKELEPVSVFSVTEIFNCYRDKNTLKLKEYCNFLLKRCKWIADDEKKEYNSFAYDVLVMALNSYDERKSNFRIYFRDCLISNFYYMNNCKRLQNLCDYLLSGYRYLSICEKEEFYSLADEAFVKALNSFDERKSKFKTHIQNCLMKKFCTEFRDRRFDKRAANYSHVRENGDIVHVISIEEEIDENFSIGDTLVSNFDIEKELKIFDDMECSNKVQRYLDSLSYIEKVIANGIMENKDIDEICHKLNISEKKYSTLLNNMFTSDRVEFLSPLLRRNYL